MIEVDKSTLQEAKAQAGDPVLVRGVAVAVIHILLRVEHGRHAGDLPQKQAAIPSRMSCSR